MASKRSFCIGEYKLTIVLWDLVVSSFECTRRFMKYNVFSLAQYTEYRKTQYSYGCEPMLTMFWVWYHDVCFYFTVIVCFHYSTSVVFNTVAEKVHSGLYGTVVCCFLVEVVQCTFYF